MNDLLHVTQIAITQGRACGHRGEGHVSPQTRAVFCLSPLAGKFLQPRCNVRVPSVFFLDSPPRELLLFSRYFFR